MNSFLFITLRLNNWIYETILYYIVSWIPFFHLTINRFQMDERTMPVLWHQALLTFSQRYKGDLSSEQKEALLQLLTAHKHPTITAEVRREILHSAPRDEEMTAVDADWNSQ